jgi:hypothetical protein
MTEEVRYHTNKNGFCSKHYKMLYDMQDRLPLALMLQTHLQEMLKELKENKSTYISEEKSGILSKFKKDASSTPLKLAEMKESCVVCSDLLVKMNKLYENFFVLYERENDFRNLFLNSKGFCIPHFLKFNEMATKNLSSKSITAFKEALYNLQIKNLNRIKEDIDWYVQKYDYRFGNEPWKNSRDAVERTIQKISSCSIVRNDSK